MKKLLTLIISLVLVISLAGCKSPATVTNDEELENRVADLEAKVDELEQILIDIEVIEGLNGQKSYYLPDANEFSIFNVSNVSAGDVELLGDELDKSSAPSYVLDENEDYIPFEDVIDKLLVKYYGDSVTLDSAKIGTMSEIRIELGDITQEEFMAKMILLIEELSVYEFYIIGSSSLYIQLSNAPYGSIIIPIQTMRSSFITITPEVIYNGLYEIQLHQLDYDKVQVQSLYDSYVLSEAYIGYALDYK